MARGRPDDEFALDDDGPGEDDVVDDDELEDDGFGAVELELDEDAEDEFGGSSGEDGESDDAEEDELFDGDVDADTTVSCPYCGETTQISLDYGSGAVQEYVEDCEVCCRPWRVLVRYDRSGAAEVTVEPT